MSLYSSRAYHERSFSLSISSLILYTRERERERVERVLEYLPPLFQTEHKCFRVENVYYHYPHCLIDL